MTVFLRSSMAGIHQSPPSTTNPPIAFKVHRDLGTTMNASKLVLTGVLAKAAGFGAKDRIGLAERQGGNETTRMVSRRSSWQPPKRRQWRGNESWG
jgi:hypothetical protein